MSCRNLPDDKIRKRRWYRWRDNDISRPISVGAVRKRIEVERHGVQRTARHH